MKQRTEKFLKLLSDSIINKCELVIAILAGLLISTFFKGWVAIAIGMVVINLIWFILNRLFEFAASYDLEYLNRKDQEDLEEFVTKLKSPYLTAFLETFLSLTSKEISTYDRKKLLHTILKNYVEIRKSQTGEAEAILEEIDAVDFKETKSDKSSADVGAGKHMSLEEAIQETNSKIPDNFPKD